MFFASQRKYITFSFSSEISYLLATLWLYLISSFNFDTGIQSMVLNGKNKMYRKPWFICHILFLEEYQTVIIAVIKLNSGLPAPLRNQPSTDQTTTAPQPIDSFICALVHLHRIKVWADFQQNSWFLNVFYWFLQETTWLWTMTLALWSSFQ